MQFIDKTVKAAFHFFPFRLIAMVASNELNFQLNQPNIISITQIRVSGGSTDIQLQLLSSVYFVFISESSNVLLDSILFFQSMLRMNKKNLGKIQ